MPTDSGIIVPFQFFGFSYWRLDRESVFRFRFLVSLIVLAKVLPRTPVYNRIVSQSSSGVESVEKIRKENESFIGQTGIALTDLRPGGKGTFGKDVIDVVSDEGLLEKGQSVRIIEFRNSTAVVIPNQENT